ncbi:MAG: O-antigen ligase domain-containing protein [Pseudomonadota bacterium]
MDITLLMLCAWVAVSFGANHGFDIGVQSGGIYFVETFGAFLVARCFIRSAEEFRATVFLLFCLICAMLPFAVIEATTGRNVLLDAANTIWFSGFDAIKKPRWGLDRVEGVMLHPILFGVFCGSALALTYYVIGFGASIFKRLISTALICLTALLSLSSGPATAILAQSFLIFWDRLLVALKIRWLILTSAITSLILTIELVANRSTPEIFISYFAFNTHTAFNRIRIWDFGSQSVLDNPLFGVGQGEWERPYWMHSSSLDMFWLERAVRSGLPAGLLLHLFFLTIFIAIARKSGLGTRASQYRKGFLICLAGLYIVGWTVNFWKVLYTYFIFLLASGIWILDEPNSIIERSEKAQERK